MKRVNKIYNCERYRRELVYITADEKDRIYCKHDLEHFLDVARIAYIMNLEQKLGYDKEVIYAIGLLHDIGRHKEYETGCNHHIASANLAEIILKEADFSKEEIAIIYDAIISHRTKKGKNKLNEIIYEADKISRKCYSCNAINICKWDENKKNMRINY